MACSAWVRWFAGSPWAFLIEKSELFRPAALNASPKKRRSAFSQRSDDFVSGSSTAILPLSFFASPCAEVFSSSDPHATRPAASTPHTSTASHRFMEPSLSERPSVDS